ncbi:MAG: RNA polymerase sigma factor [Chitinophagaceae bacterium]|nr:MAG: RNA polymerase sigma factor [Chitinophagaceae bacterium]
MTEKEFNNCVDLYAGRLFRFIIKNLKHEEDAKDIVQNSFEILWKHHHELLFEKARSYLFTTGYRNMVDHLRKGKRVNLVESFPENVKVQGDIPPDIGPVLQKGLERLSEMQRSLLMLKDYEGYSYEEIGEITELNASQVKVYLHRARLKMKEYLVKMENVL